MKIAINAHFLDAREKSGIANYIENLLVSLIKIDDLNEYYIFSNSKKINHIISCVLNRKSKIHIIKSFLSLNNSLVRILWEHLVLPFQIIKFKPDIFHNPDHILPVFPVRCKKIITVHDLAYIKYPKTFTLMKRIYKIFMIKKAVLKADRIIADSQNTKKDIVEYFNVNPQKINVIYNGIGSAFRPINDEITKAIIKEKYSLKFPFILFVGKLEPRKNIPGLIKAFSILNEKNNLSHELLIVGQKGWLFKKIFCAVDELNLGNKVRFLENVSNVDLPVIYNLADLFVYPSLYEGFGFPPLEAFACGTPVITSNVSSLPEIAGDAAVLIDPNKPDEIADAMHKVLSNENLRSDMIKKGIERAKSFTWGKCAVQTRDLYHSVIARPCFGRGEAIQC